MHWVRAGGSVRIGCSCPQVSQASPGEHCRAKNEHYKEYCSAEKNTTKNTAAQKDLYEVQWVANSTWCSEHCALEYMMWREVIRSMKLRIQFSINFVFFIFVFWSSLVFQWILNLRAVVDCTNLSLGAKSNIELQDRTSRKRWQCTVVVERSQKIG